MHIFSLTCSAVYPSRLFCCGWSCFGEIHRRDDRLLSIIMEPDGTRVHLKNSTVMSLFRNHDPVTQHNQQTLLWTVSCKSYVFLIKKLLWPRSGTRQTRSSDPHTTWNDGTWEVHSCLPDLSHQKAISWPHVSQEQTAWTTQVLSFHVISSAGWMCGVS